MVKTLKENFLVGLECVLKIEERISSTIFYRIAV